MEPLDGYGIIPIKDNIVGSQQKISDEYLAGFLDGDGSIVATLERYHSSRFPYRVRIKVNFTQHARHLQFLVRVKKILGGVGAIRVNKRKALAELVVQERNQVQEILLRLGPQLVIKRKQAVLGIKVLKILSANRKHQPSNLSADAYKRVLLLVQNIRDMNSNSGGKRPSKMITV